MTPISFPGAVIEHAAYINRMLGLRGVAQDEFRNLVRLMALGNDTLGIVLRVMMAIKAHSGELTDTLDTAAIQRLVPVDPRVWKRVHDELVAANLISPTAAAA